ncbi:hypothetical protein [Thermostaphylospora chromogena]|nr:hypothetical protein [Thermostaphylospora chromogena]
MSTATVMAGIALVCAGCGSADGAVSGASPTASSAPETPPDRVVSTTLAPPDTVPATPTGSPSPVEPKGGVANPRAVPWDSATPVGDGKRVRLIWWSGVEPCYTLDRVDVKESASSVEITLYEGPPGDAGKVACIEIAVLKTTTVELDEPVGGRTLVDGAK